MTTQTTPVAGPLDADVRRQLSALMLEAAREDMGVYCAAVVEPDGTEKKRTTWQDGYNAYGSELLDKWIALNDWVDQQSAQTRNIVHEMLLSESLYIRATEQGPVLWILMNDTFDYSTADGEDVPLCSLPVVYEAWKRWGQDGLVAWAAAQRSATPLTQRISQKYCDARRWVEHMTPNAEFSGANRPLE